MNILCWWILSSCLDTVANSSGVPLSSSTRHENDHDFVLKPMDTHGDLSDPPFKKKHMYVPIYIYIHVYIYIYMYNPRISPLPFPLLKGWTSAGYQTLFAGEIKYQRWSRATDLVVRGHALHLVAVWSRATDLVVRGHALHLVAVWSRATDLVVRGHALHLVAVWSRATDLVVRGHALHLVAVWSRATDLVVRGHALHLVAVWSRATDLVVRGHALHLVAVWSRATDLGTRGHALHIVEFFHCLNLAVKHQNDILQWFMLGCLGSHKKLIACFCGSCWVSATCCTPTFRPVVALDSHFFLETYCWMTFVMRTAFCSKTRVHKHFVEPYCGPLQMSPRKVEKHAFYVETLRRKMGQMWVSKPIDWNSSCALRSVLLPHNSDHRSIYV